MSFKRKPDLIVDLVWPLTATIHWSGEAEAPMPVLQPNRLNLVGKRSIYSNQKHSSVRSQLTAPCWISTCRLLLLPAALWATNSPAPVGFLLAALISTIAAFSDFLDGYVARRTGSATPLSSFLDLLADKVFVSTMLFLLAIQGAIPFWVPGVIITRELIVSALRVGRYRAGLAFGPNWLGKAKLVTSMGAIMLLLLRQDILRNGASSPLSVPVLSPLILSTAWWAVLLAVGMTVLSGLSYLVAYWPKAEARAGLPRGAARGEAVSQRVR